jgi:hypothetical protein
MGLRVHPPRGELKFWSILWIVFGIAASIFYAVSGVTMGLALTIPVGILSIGLWLRSKLCGYFLLGLLVLTCLVAIPLVFRGGGFDVYRAFRVCLCGYFAFLVFHWLGDYEDE